MTKCEYGIKACKNLLAEITAQAFKDAADYDPDWRPFPDLVKRAEKEKGNVLLLLNRIDKKMSYTRKSQH